MCSSDLPVIAAGLAVAGGDQYGPILIISPFKPDEPCVDSVGIPENMNKRGVFTPKIPVTNGNEIKKNA